MGCGADNKGCLQVKPREERQKVLIKVRMRNGVSWNDVCILNLSVRGLGIQAAQPPARGTIVEICRGSQVIVARVVWSKGHRAGLRSQDAIFIRAIVNEPPHGQPRSPFITEGPGERRTAPRRAKQRDDRSRSMGRAFEFVFLSLFAGGLAVTAYGAVEQALAQPMSHIRAGLHE